MYQLGSFLYIIAKIIMYHGITFINVNWGMIGSDVPKVYVFLIGFNFVLF